MFIMSRYMEVQSEQLDHVGVFVRKNVIARWGEPTVDFDNLSKLVVEDAGLSEDTKIKLISGRWVGDEPSLRLFAMGGHVPLTNTIYSGVGVNNRPAGSPSSHGLSPERDAHIRDHGTATMNKLVYNVLRAAGVRGAEFVERGQALYYEHAGDIQFTDPIKD
jgi:hypothetical protein